MSEDLELPATECPVAASEILTKLRELRDMSGTYVDPGPDPEGTRVKIEGKWRRVMDRTKVLEKCLPHYFRADLKEFDRDFRNAVNLMIEFGPSPKTSRNSIEAFNLLEQNLRNLLDAASPE